MTRALTFVTFLLVTASVASAQTPYIGASANADIVRFSGATDEFSGFNGDGEAFGWAVRAGVPLGERWGIDAEFVRAGKVTSESSFPLVFPTEPVFPPSFPVGASLDLIPNSFDMTRHERFSTLSTTAWFRHDIANRFALVYLGGLAFVREEREVNVLFPSFICTAGTIFCNDMLSVRADRTISYSAAPIVGLDARLGLTERLSVVPGVRLLVVDASGQRALMTRPSFGVQWTF
jgi:hypothetical protein